MRHLSDVPVTTRQQTSASLNNSTSAQHRLELAMQIPLQDIGGDLHDLAYSSCHIDLHTAGAASGLTSGPGSGLTAGEGQGLPPEPRAEAWSGFASMHDPPDSGLEALPEPPTAAADSKVQHFVVADVGDAAEWPPPFRPGELLGSSADCVPADASAVAAKARCSLDSGHRSISALSELSMEEASSSEGSMHGSTRGFMTYRGPLEASGSNASVRDSLGTFTMHEGLLQPEDDFELPGRVTSLSSADDESVVGCKGQSAAAWESSAGDSTVRSNPLADSGVRVRSPRYAPDVFVRGIEHGQPTAAADGAMPRDAAGSNRTQSAQAGTSSTSGGLSQVTSVPHAVPAVEPPSGGLVSVRPGDSQAHEKPEQETVGRAEKVLDDCENATAAAHDSVGSAVSTNATAHLYAADAAQQCVVLEGTCSQTFPSNSRVQTVPKADFSAACSTRDMLGNCVRQAMDSTEQTSNSMHPKSEPTKGWLPAMPLSQSAVCNSVDASSIRARDSSDGALAPAVGRHGSNGRPPERASNSNTLHQDTLVRSSRSSKSEMHAAKGFGGEDGWLHTNQNSCNQSSEVVERSSRVTSERGSARIADAPDETGDEGEQHSLVAAFRDVHENVRRSRMHEEGDHAEESDLIGGALADGSGSGCEAPRGLSEGSGCFLQEEPSGGGCSRKRISAVIARLLCAYEGNDTTVAVPESQDVPENQPAATPLLQGVDGKVSRGDMHATACPTTAAVDRAEEEGEWRRHADAPGSLCMSGAVQTGSVKSGDRGYGEGVRDCVVEPEITKEKVSEQGEYLGRGSQHAHGQPLSEIPRSCTWNKEVDAGGAVHVGIVNGHPSLPLAEREQTCGAVNNADQAEVSWNMVAAHGLGCPRTASNERLGPLERQTSPTAEADEGTLHGRNAVSPPSSANRRPSLSACANVWPLTSSEGGPSLEAQAGDRSLRSAEWRASVEAEAELERRLQRVSGSLAKVQQGGAVGMSGCEEMQQSRAGGSDDVPGNAGASGGEGWACSGGPHHVVAGSDLRISDAQEEHKAEGTSGRGGQSNASKMACADADHRNVRQRAVLEFQTPPRPPEAQSLGWMLSAPGGHSPAADSVKQEDVKQSPAAAFYGGRSDPHQNGSRVVLAHQGRAGMAALQPTKRSSSARLSERRQGDSLFATLTMPNEVLVGGLLTMLEGGDGSDAAGGLSDSVSVPPGLAAKELLLQEGSNDGGSEPALYRDMARTTIHGNPMFFREGAASSIGATDLSSCCHGSLQALNGKDCAEADSKEAEAGPSVGAPAGAVVRKVLARSSSAVVGPPKAAGRDHKGLSLFDTLTMPRNLQLTSEVLALAAECACGFESFPDASTGMDVASRGSAEGGAAAEFEQQQMRATVHGNPMYLPGCSELSESACELLEGNALVWNVPHTPGVDGEPLRDITGQEAAQQGSDTGSDDAGRSVEEVALRLQVNKEAVTCVLRELKAALGREPEDGGPTGEASGARASVVQRLSECVERVGDLVASTSLCGSLSADSLQRTAADHFGVSKRHPKASQDLANLWGHTPPASPRIASGHTAMPTNRIVDYAGGTGKHTAADRTAFTPVMVAAIPTTVNGVARCSNSCTKEAKPPPAACSSCAALL
jgi:hypothetical protein